MAHYLCPDCQGTLMIEASSMERCEYLIEPPDNNHTLHLAYDCVGCNARFFHVIHWQPFYDVAHNAVFFHRTEQSWETAQHCPLAAFPTAP